VNDGARKEKCDSGNRKLSGTVRLVVGGTEIELVPFVNNIVRDTVLAVIKELNGYEDGAKIEITIE
jgi:molybdopterin-guanine dinucleotide biosynthesis protein B